MTDDRPTLTDGGTGPYDHVLDPIREHREAVEVQLLDRDDEIGAEARVQLALVDGEQPDPKDLATLGISDPRSDTDTLQREFQPGAFRRSLSPTIVEE
jgi:hypothetical protein